MHIAIADGEPIIESTLDPEVAKDRGALLSSRLALDVGTHPQEGWGACGFAAASTVVGMAAANPWAVASAVAAACTCLP